VKSISCSPWSKTRSRRGPTTIQARSANHRRRTALRKTKSQKLPNKNRLLRSRSKLPNRKCPNRKPPLSRTCPRPSTTSRRRPISPRCITIRHRRRICLSRTRSRRTCRQVPTRFRRGRPSRT
jgi:hypothetical protein